MIESTLNTLIAEMRQLDGNEKDINKLVKDTAKKLAKKLSKNEPEPKKVKGKKTVYQIFCSKNRDTSLSFVEANRAISTKWKALTADEKAEFAASVQSEIDADVERFNEETASSSDDEKVEKNDKKKKDPNAPKRPLGSFMLFCKEQRESNSDLKGVDGTKRISEAWNALSASAKEVYTNKAKVLMDAFKGKPVEEVEADLPSKMEVVEIESPKSTKSKKSKKVDESSSDETEKAEKAEKKKEKKTKKVVDDESSSDETEKAEKKKEKKAKKVVDEESSSDEKTEKAEKKTKKAKKVDE